MFIQAPNKLILSKKVIYWRIIKTLKNMPFKYKMDDIKVDE